MKHVPIRTCIVTRVKKPKNQLVRIVRTEDGDVVVDNGEKIKGRGANIDMKVEIFDKAIKKHILTKALKLNREFSEAEVSKLRQDFINFIEEKEFRHSNKPVKIRITKQDLLNKINVEA